MNKPADTYFNAVGPPNSPKIFGCLLRIAKIAMQIIEPIKNKARLVANEPAATRNTVPLYQWYIAAIAHAIPMPKNTFTAFEPVTLPIDESAVLSCLAELTDAKVSESKSSQFFISRSL